MNEPTVAAQAAALIVTSASEAMSIINARDCELAGFDLAAVLEASKTAAP